MQNNHEVFSLFIFLSALTILYCLTNLTIVINVQGNVFRYEAAGTLITLSSAPAAIKAAATAYIDLIVKESDNNVKLIVLDRLIDLRYTIELQ